MTTMGHARVMLTARARPRNAARPTRGGSVDVQPVPATSAQHGVSSPLAACTCGGACPRCHASTPSSRGAARAMGGPRGGIAVGDESPADAEQPVPSAAGATLVMRKPPHFPQTLQTCWASAIASWSLAKGLVEQGFTDQ